MANVFLTNKNKEKKQILIEKGSGEYQTLYILFIEQSIQIISIKLDVSKETYVVTVVLLAYRKSLF